MSYDGDLLFIDVLYGHEVVDNAMNAPRPRSNRAEFLSRFHHRLVADAIRIPIYVRLHVAIIENGNGISAIDRLLYVPDIDRRTTACFGCPIILDPRARISPSI